jgi:integration host factor subunit beta
MQINIRGIDMTKNQVIQTLKLECGISKKEAATVVDLFFGKISDALSRGDRVEIRGFCSFFVKQYEKYDGMNPRTGEIVKVPTKKLPFFRCGKELKESVDY